MVTAHTSQEGQSSIESRTLIACRLNLCARDLSGYTCSGDAIPHVDYTEEENKTWRTAYEQLKELRSTHTCSEYVKNVRQMELAGVITGEKIPQLRDLNVYIQSERLPKIQKIQNLERTGFELRPCGGLLSARDFLASLAFRIFQVHPPSF